MNDYLAIQKHIRYYQVQRSVDLAESIADFLVGLTRLMSGPVARKSTKRPSGAAPIPAQG